MKGTRQSIRPLVLAAVVAVVLTGACRDASDKRANASPSDDTTVETTPVDPTVAADGSGDPEPTPTAAADLAALDGLMPEASELAPGFVLEDERRFTASSTTMEGFALDGEVAEALGTTYLSLGYELGQKGFTAGVERDFRVEGIHGLDDFKLFLLAVGSEGEASDIVSHLARQGFRSPCGLHGGTESSIEGVARSTVCDFVDDTDTERVAGAVAIDRFVAVAVAAGDPDPAHRVHVEGALSELAGKMSVGA